MALSIFSPNSMHEKERKQGSPLRLPNGVPRKKCFRAPLVRVPSGLDGMSARSVRFAEIWGMQRCAMAEAERRSEKSLRRRGGLSKDFGDSIDPEAQ